MADIVHRLDAKKLRLVLRLPFMFGFRMWLTVQILKLAGMVSPATIEITHAVD